MRHDARKSDGKVAATQAELKLIVVGQGPVLAGLLLGLGHCIVVTAWLFLACLHFVLEQVVRWFDRGVAEEQVDVEPPAEDCAGQGEVVVVVVAAAVLAVAAAAAGELSGLWARLSRSVQHIDLCQCAEGSVESQCQVLAQSYRR